MATTEPFSLEGVPCMAAGTCRNQVAYKLRFGAITIVVCKPCMANLLKTHAEIVDSKLPTVRRRVNS